MSGVRCCLKDSRAAATLHQGQMQTLWGMTHEHLQSHRSTLHRSAFARGALQGHLPELRVLQRPARPLDGQLPSSRALCPRSGGPPARGCAAQVPRQRARRRARRLLLRARAALALGRLPKTRLRPAQAHQFCAFSEYSSQAGTQPAYVWWKVTAVTLKVRCGVLGRRLSHQQPER